MNKYEVLAMLREHRATLSHRFGVAELSLFGSFARDQATEHSDVDILVRFETPPGWERYFAAQAYLEDLLGRTVNMATRPELRPQIRRRVDRELIDV